MPAIEIRNLSEFLRAFNKAEADLYKAVEQATLTAALAVEKQAKLNASGPTHKRNEKRIAWAGAGPNLVTGTLRRSIKAETIKGFDSYKAIIGASVEYARAVELGSPRWKSGVQYPYLNPALQMLAQNGTVERVFNIALRKRLVN